MNKINKKILEDIETLSKSMEKNQLSELKFSDKETTYELKKVVKQQSPDINNISYEKKNLTEKKYNPTEFALKSPLVGTAYLSPEPGAKKFIEEGQVVKIGQVLLIIEAMKTMK